MNTLSTPANLDVLSHLLSRLIPDPSNQSGRTVVRIEDFYAAYTIVKCTRAQVERARRNTFEWMGRREGLISVDEWLKRCERNEDEKVVTWGLVPRDDLLTTDLRAHCLTAVSCLADPSSSSVPRTTQLKETNAYGISKLYCPPRHRSKGFGRHLLRLLHYVLSPPEHMPPFPTAWGQEPKDTGWGCAGISWLYSGIWGGYYEGCTRGLLCEGGRTGWEKQEVVMRVWDVGDSSFGFHSHSPKEIELRNIGGDQATCRHQSSDEGWIWLDGEGIRSFEETVANDMKRSLAFRGNHKKTRLAILPIEGTLSSQARALSHNDPERQRSYGLVIPSTGLSGGESLSSASPSRQQYIIYNTLHSSLQIIFATASFPFRAVLKAAVKEGCSTIGRWSAPADDLWAGLPADPTSSSESVDEGNDHGDAFGWGNGENEVKGGVRPYLCVYGIEGQVEWVFNERYAWV